MPSALRLVRSGILLLSLSITAPAMAGGDPRDASSGATQPAAQQQPHAAVMDLWLATSLSLVLLYIRRRRRARD